MTPVRWLLATAAELPPEDRDGDWLDADARERLARMPLPQRRSDFRLGRWTAKRAVAAWLGLDAGALARIAIVAAEDGAPEAFLDGSPAPLVLSLTHRAGLAVCAVAPAGTVLGCDLESIEPRSPAFVADYFTEAERALVENADEEDRPLLANLLWSAKESALKALRTGLRLDTREVEVAVQKNPPPDLPHFPATTPVVAAGQNRGDRVLGSLPHPLPGGEAPPSQALQASQWEPMGWSPVTVHRRETGETFHGWWRREGDHLLTVAARPAPAVPVAF